MQICLVRPNYKSHLITPPLGLGYISSYLRKHGYKTKIIDGLNLNISNEEIVHKCKEADYVGISCLSAFYLNVIDLCRKLKKAGKKVVVGGAHPTILPEMTLQDTGADFVVVGEGERAFLSIVEGREKGKIVKNDFLNDLNELPFPDWMQMDPRRYKKAPHGAFIKNFPVAPITSTRGCPFECTFCASPRIWKKRIRYRSPKNVVDEIEYLIENFGVREIHFEDDNLTLNREHILGICNEILRRKIRVSIACPNGVRADRLDRELLRLMKKTGFYYLAFGVESGNQEILNSIKKHIKIETLKKAIAMTEDEGIMTQGFFIFGLPGETEGTIENTIRFAKNSKLSRAQFLLLDVFPGSELEKTLSYKFDWTKDSYHEITWCPSTVDKRILEKAPSRAFREFFLRPRQLWCLLRYFKLEQLPFLIKRVSDFKIVK